MTKVCNKCGIEQPLENFYRHPATRDGRGYSCKSCAKLAMKAWRAAHPEKRRLSNRRWEQAHPDKKREKNRRYREQHRDEARAAHRRWTKAHLPERAAYLREWRRRRREQASEDTGTS